MTADGHRKLLIAAGAVAAFFGFVALTGWTSSGEMDEQERREMATFCYALTLDDAYENMITDAAAAGGEGAFGGGAIDGWFSDAIEGPLLQYAPEGYREDAARLVEGFERGLRGQLSPGEAEEYAADFRRLEARASGDCDEFEDEAPGFGGGPGFGFPGED